VGGPKQSVYLPTDSYESGGSHNALPPSRPVIFVVEDDADIARLIAHNLQAAGFNVQRFDSASSVITEAIREVPALFLLDVMLPGTDGFELCRHIRQNPALAGIPVIFLTAKTSESDRVKGLELGGDDYITKPFSPRELLARIRTILRGVGQSASEAEVLRLGDLQIVDDRPSKRSQRSHHGSRIPTARVSRDPSRTCPHPRSTAGCRMEGNSFCDATFD
jgi:DNA-binding response OmpR family regulator